MRYGTDPLSGKRLYIAHLAERLEGMETGRRPMKAVAYRLCARRMKSALAGYPEALLAVQLGKVHPSVKQALEQRHFEVHGALLGRAGERARKAAAALLGRLARVPR